MTDTAGYPAGQYPAPPPLAVPPDPPVGTTADPAAAAARQAERQALLDRQAAELKEARERVTKLEAEANEVEITPEQQARADALYAEFKPEASASYLNYFVAHTPPELHPAMKLLVEADLGPEAPPPEPDPTVASVANGSSVAVTDLAGAAVPGSPGTAEVANSALTAVHLTV